MRNIKIYKLFYFIGLVILTQMLSTHWGFAQDLLKFSTEHKERVFLSEYDEKINFSNSKMPFDKFSFINIRVGYAFVKLSTEKNNTIEKKYPFNTLSLSYKHSSFNSNKFFWEYEISYMYYEWSLENIPVKYMVNNIPIMIYFGYQNPGSNTIKFMPRIGLGYGLIITKAELQGTLYKQLNQTSVSSALMASLGVDIALRITKQIFINLGLHVMVSKDLKTSNGTDTYIIPKFGLNMQF